MTATPDTLLVTGPVNQQVPSNAILVTPDGGSQTTLALALATIPSGALTATSVTGTAATLPITGLAAAQGGSATLKGGASSTSGNAGGAAAVTGGTGGATGAGGAATLTGGTGGATSGTGGAITITSGPAGATTGVAGAVNIAAGLSTVGAGAAVTVTAGAGAGGTAAGGDVNLIPGAAVSTGTPGEFKINSNSNVSFATYFCTGTPAATDQVFFVATRAMRVKTISAVFSVAAGGASTLTVIKDTGTSAPGAGTSLHQSGSFNLNSTANTVQNATVSTTIATVTMAAGDRLAVKFANTIQSTAGLVVTVGMVPV